MTLAVLGALALASSAPGRDLNAALSEAESRVESASTEVAELEADLAPARKQVEASAAQATPTRTAARAAEGRAAAIERRLRRRHLAAMTRVARIGEEKSDAADKHARTVRAGLGIALAALIAATIAFAWGRFRASQPVAWLTRVSLGQAIGLCVGGGLLLVIVGAAMSGVAGVVGVLGVALFALGFVLANAFVLARHSVEVQRGRAKPVLGRERWPRRIAQIAGGALASLCLIGLGTAVFAGESESSEASGDLRREAGRGGPGSPALRSAKESAAKLNRKAAPLIAAARANRRELRIARRKLRRAKTRLANAEGDAASYTRRLAVLTEREEQRVAAEARRAEEKAEELEAERCDPNYSGCLDPNAVDYDCEGGSGNGPLYTGTVEVLGVDHYGLDADGDGIGCESE